MKKIFKKNQIIVTVLAILIVIAGYLKYTDANFNNKNKGSRILLIFVPDI